MRPAEPVSEAVRVRPRGPLASLVTSYSGYRERGIAPARHLGLPSPYLTVIFTLDEPLQLAQHVDPSTPARSYEHLVGGLHDRPAVITHDGAQSGVQLRMSPLASRALFGVPAGELASIDLSADEVLGSTATRLVEEFRSKPDWAARCAVFDSILAARAATAADDGVGPDWQVCRAWDLIMRSGGRARISAVAWEVGWSERHLANRFHAEIGLTPKIAARVVRFDRARRDLLRGRRDPDQEQTLAAVAASHGYADQSHLVRDFVDFAGLPPTAWLRAEFGNVQALPAPAGAS